MIMTRDARRERQTQWSENINSGAIKGNTKHCFSANLKQTNDCEVACMCAFIYFQSSNLHRSPFVSTHLCENNYYANFAFNFSQTPSPNHRHLIQQANSNVCTLSFIFI
jgi:hypothetical protein